MMTAALDKRRVCSVDPQPVEWKENSMSATRLLIQSTVLCVSSFLLAGSDASGAVVTVNVKITNLAPAEGNFLTPLWAGFHDGSFDLYDIGSPATAGLERLAEDGNTGPLSGEFLGSGAGLVDGTIAGPGGPFAPGEMASMNFLLDNSAATSRYFSYASMVIPSNDAFIANGDPIAHEVFDAGGNFLGADFIVLGTGVRDAGTEVNDEIPANTAFLGQTVPDTGVPEGGTVQVHPGFIPGGNILTAFPNADFTVPGYQVARITVTAVPEPSALLTWACLLAVGLVGIQRVRTHSRE